MTGARWRVAGARSSAWRVHRPRLPSSGAGARCLVRRPGALPRPRACVVLRPGAPRPGAGRPAPARLPPRGPRVQKSAHPARQAARTGSVRPKGAGA